MAEEAGGGDSGDGKVEEAWRGIREAAQVQREEASRRLAWYCQRAAWRASPDEQVCAWCVGVQVCVRAVLCVCVCQSTLMT